MIKKLPAVMLVLSLFLLTVGAQIIDAKPTMQELAAKYPQIVFNRGYPVDKKIALTFDDAPDDNVTYKILDILKEKQVKATFFVIGSSCAKHIESLQRIHLEGHVIGNHTWSHNYTINDTNESFFYEVMETEKIISQVTGQHVHLFRPPYGTLDEEFIPVLNDLGFHVIGWNSDSYDWRGIPQDEVIANIFKNVAPGTIVLQHSYNNPKLANTVNALPEIIDRLRAEGYAFVTVPEMLDTGPINVIINKEPVNFTEAKCWPKINNKTLYSPLRATLKNLGAQITWDQDNRTITINKNTDTISMNIDSKVAYVNNQQVLLETPPHIDILSGQTLVPLRFVCENLNTLVDIKLTGQHTEVNVIDDTLNNINIFTKSLT